MEIYKLYQICLWPHLLNQRILPIRFQLLTIRRLLFHPIDQFSYVLMIRLDGEHCNFNIPDLSRIILHQIMVRYLTSLLTVQHIADFLRSLEEIGKRVASLNPVKNIAIWCGVFRKSLKGLLCPAVENRLGADATAAEAEAES